MQNGLGYMVGSSLSRFLRQHGHTRNMFSAGDMVFCEALGTPMLLVSSPKVAADLMDKRSALYSDRPQITMAELCDLSCIIYT